MGRCDWDGSISLGCLLAANGFLVVMPETYEMILSDSVEALNGLLTQIINDGNELYMDSKNLAVWSEGHSVPLTLPMLFDVSNPFHEDIQCVVLSSPVMTYGSDNFDALDSSLIPDIPYMVVKGEKEIFFEVNHSVKNFLENADEKDLDLTYFEVGEARHNWMTELDAEASRNALRAEIKYLKKHL